MLVSDLGPLLVCCFFVFFVVAMIWVELRIVSACGL
jgi:hypothetical protein